MEVCDFIAVLVCVRGMISDAESETDGVRWPLNRRTLETMVSFREMVGHFLAFFPFSRALRGRSPQAPASTTVR